VETPRKNVVVNYTYFLKNKEHFSDLQKYLFQYSYIKCKQFGYIIHIHCNNLFQEVCEELGIIPDKFIPLEEDKDIDSKVFWAYHKIKVYDKCSVGEWHLDVDAVFKSDPTEPLFKKDVDIYTAYIDEPEFEFENIYLPPNYTLPVYATPSYTGLNMSAVYFNSQELKDKYCEESLKFMRNNIVLKDNGWAHMVFAEQSLLKQMCEHYNYSYKFIIDNTDYYHLGAAKQLLSQEEKENLINKINNKIWQHITLTTSES
jgi:hypothetical protein